MAIVFAGTSLADFVIAGFSAARSSSVGTLATNFTEGFQISSSATVQATAQIDLATALAELWLSFEVYSSNLATQFPYLEFYNTAYSTTQPLFTLRWTGTGPISFQYWNGTAMVTSGTLPASFIEAETHRFDVRVKLADVGGIFEVVRDRVTTATMTQTDTIQTAATTIDRIRLSGPGSGSDTYWHNIFVADEDTKPYEMYSARVTGAGALAQWTGAVGNINENGFNDTTTLSAGAADLTSTFTLETIPTKFTHYKVASVFLGGRAQGGVADPTTFDAAARVGGTVYQQTLLRALGPSFGPFIAKWAVNPATGLPWTIAEIGASQFGFKSKT